MRSTLGWISVCVCVCGCVCVWGGVYVYVCDVTGWIRVIHRRDRVKPCSPIAGLAHSWLRALYSCPMYEPPDWQDDSMSQAI